MAFCCCSAVTTYFRFIGPVPGGRSRSLAELAVAACTSGVTAGAADAAETAAGAAETAETATAATEAVVPGISGEGSSDPIRIAPLLRFDAGGEFEEVRSVVGPGVAGLR